VFGKREQPQAQDFQRSGQTDRWPEGIAVIRVPLGSVTLGNFPDGETNVRIDEDVRGRDVFIIQPTCTPVNEKPDGTADHAGCVQACAAQPGSPPSTVLRLRPPGPQGQGAGAHLRPKLVANLITKAGADRVLALDLHAAQIQGFFDIPVDHLYAVKEIAKHVRSLTFRRTSWWSLARRGEHQESPRLSRSTSVGKSPSRQAANQRHRGEAPPPDWSVARWENGRHLRRPDLDGRNELGRRSRVPRQGAGAKSVYVCATHGVLCGSAIKN